MKDDLEIILGKINSLLDQTMPWIVKSHIYDARSDIERALDCIEQENGSN